MRSTVSNVVSASSTHISQSWSAPLKMLKRQTYGRAAFPLLRKRVLLVS